MKRTHISPDEQWTLGEYEYADSTSALGPARGCLFGIAVSLFMWLGLAGAVYVLCF